MDSIAASLLIVPLVGFSAVTLLVYALVWVVHLAGTVGTIPVAGGAIALLGGIVAATAISGRGTGARARG